MSGLPEARLRAGIGGTGTRGDRCTARAALIDAVLEQPPAAALPMLHAL